MDCVNAMRRLLLLLFLLTRSCVSGNVNSVPPRGVSSGVLGKNSRKTVSVTPVEDPAPSAFNSNDVPLFCPSVLPHGSTLRSPCYGFQAWLPKTIRHGVTFVTIPLAHTSTMSNCDFKHPFRACDFHVCIYKHPSGAAFKRRPFDVALRFENSTANYRVTIGVRVVEKNKYLFCGSVKRCTIWNKFRCAGTRQEELCRRVGFNGNWTLYVNAHDNVNSQGVGTRALFLSTYIENVSDISNPMLQFTGFPKIDTPVVIPVLERNHTRSVLASRDTFDDDMYSEGSEDDQRNVISKERGYHDALASASDSKKLTLSQLDSRKALFRKTELKIANGTYNYVDSIKYLSSDTYLPRCVPVDSNVAVARIVQLEKHKRRIDAVLSGNVLRDGDFQGRFSTPPPKYTTPGNRSIRIPGVTKSRAPHLLTTLPIHLPDDIHPGVPRSPGMVVGVGIAGGVLVGFVGFLLWRVSSGQHPFLLRHGASAAAAQQGTELRSNLRRFSTFTGPSRGWDDDAYQHGNGNADLADYYSDAGSFASIH